MVDVEPLFISDGEPSEPFEPCEAALDHLSMTTEFLAGLDAASGDAGLDPATHAGPAAASMVVSFIGVQLVGSAAQPAAPARYRRHGIQQRFEGHAVVDVSSGQQKGEWDAAPVGDQMAFGARPASIGGVRTCRGTPFLAAMDELSMQARLQSMRSARSCFKPWCRNGAAEQGWLLDQAAIDGRLMVRSSLSGAMVSSVM